MRTLLAAALIATTACATATASDLTLDDNIRFDASLDALIRQVFAKDTLPATTCPVHAALHALVASPHPEAAVRMFEGRPELKGVRGDQCWSRVAYVVVARPAPELAQAFAAIASDSAHPQRYVAEAVVDCLKRGRKGALLDFCF